MLTIGFLVFAGVYAAFAAIGDAWSVWPLFAIYGAYIALTEGIGRAYISDLVPEDRRASAIGLYGASTGAMLLIASIIGGALWDLVGPQATFAFGAGTASLAAIVFLTTSRQLGPP